MANPRVGDVTKRARALLNDIGTGRYTDQILLPFVQQALDELSADLRLHGIPAVDTTNAVNIIIPAGVAFIDYLSTPPLPPGLLTPIKLEEKAQSDSIEKYIPMTRVRFDPVMKMDTILRYWWWQTQTIYLVGATQIREVRITFQTIFAPLVDPVDPGQLILYNDSLLFLSTKTAALAAQLVAQNQSRAAVLQDEASYHLKVARKVEVKSEQTLAVRRRPFTNPLRVFGGRYRR